MGNPLALGIPTGVYTGICTIKDNEIVLGGYDDEIKKYYQNESAQQYNHIENKLTEYENALNTLNKFNKSLCKHEQSN